MRRTIELLATWYAVGGSLVDKGMCVVPCDRVWKKSLVVRLVVQQHENVIVAGAAWTKVDVAGLHKIARFCLVDGRTKWTWHFLPT